MSNVNGSLQIARAGKKKGLLRSISKSLRKKSSKGDRHSGTASLASDDSASTIAGAHKAAWLSMAQQHSTQPINPDSYSQDAGSVSGQPDDQWLPPSEQSPVPPSPLSRQSPAAHPGTAQHAGQPGGWQRQGLMQPGLGWAAAREQSSPMGVSPSDSQDNELPQPASPASPMRWPAGNGHSPDSPELEPANGTQVS